MIHITKVSSTSQQFLCPMRKNAYILLLLTVFCWFSLLCSMSIKHFMDSYSHTCFSIQTMYSFLYTLLISSCNHHFWSILSPCTRLLWCVHSTLLSLHVQQFLRSCSRVKNKNCYDGEKPTNPKFTPHELWRNIQSKKHNGEAAKLSK